MPKGSAQRFSSRVTRRGEKMRSAYFPKWGHARHMGDSSRFHQRRRIFLASAFPRDSRAEWGRVLIRTVSRCARVLRCICRPFGERLIVRSHGRVWRLYVAISTPFSGGARQVAENCYACHRRPSRKQTAGIRRYYAPYPEESAIARIRRTASRRYTGRIYGLIIHPCM